jgi:hypothetical protein
MSADGYDVEAVVQDMDSGAERVDRWLRADGWKEDKKRKVGDAVFSWLPAAAGGSVGGGAGAGASPSTSTSSRFCGSSDRTVWKLEVTLPSMTPDVVFSTFTARMGEIIPPGVSYKTRELTAEQPWANVGIHVWRSITTPFVGGLVSSAWISACGDSMHACMCSHHHNTVGRLDGQCTCTACLQCMHMCSNQ